MAVAAKNQPETVSKPMLEPKPKIISTKPKMRGNLANLNKRINGSNVRIIGYPVVVERVVQQRNLHVVIRQIYLAVLFLLVASQKFDHIVSNLQFGG